MPLPSMVLPLVVKLPVEPFKLMVFVPVALVTFKAPDVLLPPKFKMAEPVVLPKVAPVLASCKVVDPPVPPPVNVALVLLAFNPFVPVALVTPKPTPPTPLVEVTDRLAWPTPAAPDWIDELPLTVAPLLTNKPLLAVSKPLFTVKVPLVDVAPVRVLVEPAPPILLFEP